MKRVLFALVIVVTVAVVAALLYLRSSSGFRSVYLVPSDAVLLVESKDPVTAWDKIVHSKTWNYLSTNEFLQELNSDIQSFDSLVNSSKFLMKLAGKKPVMASQHPLGNGRFDLLYIVEAGKIGKLKNPEKVLNSVLGNGYEITSRVYHDVKIVELYDKDAGEYYFLSFIHGKLLFSFESLLVEASIDAANEMLVGRERKFMDVYSKLNASGLVNIYINHNQLGPFINSFSTEAREDFLMRLGYLQFTGISFQLDEAGEISIEGYSSISDTLLASYKNLFNSGNLDLATSDVIPNRLASLAKVNFDNANEYFHASMKTMGQEDYQAYLKNLNKIEKKFNFSLEEYFFSWMDKEIVMLQTKPSNLGRDNEFAVVMHAKDSVRAAENLQYLWKQIKKNSPVKVKSVPYSGYRIDYIAFPGFIKLLFGKMLGEIEKPYISQIGENVILSNHPQTIKNLIDDYHSGATLNNSISYYNFIKPFGNKASMFGYAEPPVLFYNMKQILTPVAWQNFKENKKYFTCFSQAGIFAELDDGMIHFSFRTHFQPEQADYSKQYYNPYSIENLFNAPEPEIEEVKPSKKDTVPFIVIHQLDASEQKEYFEDGTLWRYLELKNGLKNGTFKEYYPNGKLKIKGGFSKDVPTGKWKYYNEEGELIKTDRY
jgi:hypothetical protein